ncbi:MAG: hypothetical protein WBM00_09715, partial [Solirubrobacterales bacterium]
MSGYRHDEAGEEIVLDGYLAEFRVALTEEINAARQAASSSAIPLVNGRRIGRAGIGCQYQFTSESMLNDMPDGAPGDLMIPGQPPLEAVVVAVDGLTMTLGLSSDVGDFIPRAKLQSSLVHLLRKLIERIEGLAEQDNPAGGRLLGQINPHGEPVEAR